MTSADALVTVRVRGASMWPTLAPGDTLVVALAPHCRSLGHRWPPREGDIVIARHPFRRRTLLVKRIDERQGQRFVLRGDAGVQSEDSGALGAFPLRDLIGLVVDVVSQDGSSRTR